MRHDIAIHYAGDDAELLHRLTMRLTPLGYTVEPCERRWFDRLASAWGPREVLVIDLDFASPASRTRLEALSTLPRAIPYVLLVDDEWLAAVTASAGVMAEACLSRRLDDPDEIVVAIDACLRKIDRWNAAISMAAACNA